MGQQRLELYVPGAEHTSPPEDNESTKAKKTLYELEQLSTAPPAFGTIQSVPWLDALTKQHCEDCLALEETKQQAKDDSVSTRTVLQKGTYLIYPIQAVFHLVKRQCQ